MFVTHIPFTTPTIDAMSVCQDTYFRMSTAAKQHPFVITITIAPMTMTFKLYWRTVSSCVAMPRAFRSSENGG